jgi:ABC-type Fe3+-siderophore transport system permease subunit
MTDYAEGTSTVRSRRANPMGAYITLAGIALFTIAVFLDWLSADIEDTAQVSGQSVSGYETDSLIPFVAYLGIGLAAALLYAMTRAHRRQHRGLTLTSMAVGIAATLLALSYLIDAPGISERGRDLSPEIGVWLALIGGLLWAAGSGLFAKEIEGDDHDGHRDDTAYGRGRAA